MLRADGQHGKREWNVQPEYPPPARRLGEQATDQRAGRIPQSRYAVSQPDRVTGACG